MGKIFSGDIKSHLLAFLSAKADSHADDVAMLQGIAKENKGKMLFVTINTDEDDHKRILDFFGITESELPTFRAIQLGEDMAKYKPEDDKIEAENIKAFVAKFLAGELKLIKAGDNSIVDFDGERTEAGFTKFLDAQCGGDADAAAAKDELSTLEEICLPTRHFRSEGSEGTNSTNASNGCDNTRHDIVTLDFCTREPVKCQSVSQYG